MTREAPTVTVNGYVADGFEPVREAFAANFTERGDRGAAFAAYRNDEKVVDLWGGWADRDAGVPWSENTLQFIFSGTKGLTAACVLLLRDRGLIDEAKPVAHYWPEFAQNGKERVTVRHVLTHTAGVPGIREPFTMRGVLDDVGMAERVAAEAPFWAPGETLCYHPITFGYLAGELVRRIDGRSVGRFFAEEFAQPLGLESWIGLPAEQESRVSTLVLDDSWGQLGPYPPPAPERAEYIDAIVNNPRFRHADPIPWNEREFHSVEAPAINGITTARSMAKFYAMFASRGEFEGRRYLSPEAVGHASETLESGIEWMSEVEWNLGPGFQQKFFAPLSAPEVRATGHGGAGGSNHGFWPDLSVSFSYAMNQLRQMPDDRGPALLDALYRSLGS